MTPRITVAVAIYNGAQFLAETLASLLAQSLPDFRLICLDDASTDDSVAIASRFSDPRITIDVAPRHTSLPENWNRAIAAARGDYLVIAHQDDVYERDFLAATCRLLDDHPHAFAAHTRAMVIDESHEVARSPAAAYKERFWPRAEPYERTPQDEARTLLKGNYIVAPAVMLRLSAVQKIGPFNPRFHFVTDWEYWLRGVALGYSITGTHARLVRFRRHPQTATRANEVSMRRYEEELALLASFAPRARRARAAENTLLSDFGFRLASGDANGARQLADYASARFPNFRGTARERLMRASLNGGRAAGAALQFLERAYIRGAVAAHRLRERLIV